MDISRRCHEINISRREEKDYKESGKHKNEIIKPEGKKRMIGFKTGREARAWNNSKHNYEYSVLQKTYQ